VKTTVFCGSGAALIDFGGPLTELRAGSLVTDRSVVIARYEHLPELQHIEESSFPNRLQHYVTSLASRPSVVGLPSRAAIAHDELMLRDSAGRGHIRNVCGGGDCDIGAAVAGR
jgi:hypothetical protein